MFAVHVWDNSWFVFISKGSPRLTQKRKNLAHAWPFWSVWSFVETRTFILLLGSCQSAVIGLYQVILSQRRVCESGNFRFIHNKHDLEQQGNSPLTAHRSATAKCTIWIDSSPYLACPLNRRLMNLIRLVRWNSHSENPTSLPSTWPRANTEIHTAHPHTHTHR